MAEALGMVECMGLVAMIEAATQWSRQQTYGWSVGKRSTRVWSQLLSEAMSRLLRQQ